MNQDEILRRVLAFDDYMNQLTANYTEAVTMTDEEVRNYMARLENDPPFGVDFYMVMGSISNDVTHPIGVKENLPVPKGKLTDFDYFRLVHPDYSIDYLEWAQAAYTFVDSLSRLGQMETLKTSYRLTFPILRKDGEYWWVRMAVTTLQLDASNNVITHLNSYTFTSPFDDREAKRPLIGEIWGEAPKALLANWTRELRKLKSLIPLFQVTDTEMDILKISSRHPNYKSADIASMLNKKTNTIERHRRNIIAKAKDAFPIFHDRQRLTIKEIAQLLKSQSYFDPNE